MKKTLATIWSLLLGIFLMAMATSLLSNVIGLRAKAEGFSTSTIGIIMASFYIGYSIGARQVPKFIRNVGYIRVFAALMSCVSIAALAFPIYIDSTAWTIARILLGFCTSGLYLVAESWLNSQSDNKSRAQVLGIYAIAIFSGMALGAQLLRFVNIEDFVSFAFASIIFSIAAIPMLLTKMNVPNAPLESANMSIKKLYEISPLGTFAVFMSNMIIAITLSLASVYGQQVGMSMATISTFVSLNIVACIFTQFPIGKLSDSMDRRYVIIFVTAVAGAFSLFTALQTQENTILWLFAIIGGITLPQYSLAVAYVNDRLSIEQVLPASSAIILVSGIGAVIGPLLTGFFMDWFGAKSFFITIALASSSVTLFAVVRMIQRPETATSDDSFNPIGINASAISVVHEDILDAEQFEDHIKDHNTPEK